MHWHCTRARRHGLRRIQIADVTDATDPAQTKFEVFQGEMKAHLDEEENEVVPVMRRTFKQQEERKVRCDAYGPPSACFRRTV